MCRGLVIAFHFMGSGLAAAERHVLSSAALLRSFRCGCVAVPSVLFDAVWRLREYRVCQRKVELAVSPTPSRPAISTVWSPCSAGLSQLIDSFFCQIVDEPTGARGPPRKARWLVLRRAVRRLISTTAFGLAS